jgi:hypothetical protein
MYMPRYISEINQRKSKGLDPRNWHEIKRGDTRFVDKPGQEERVSTIIRSYSITSGDK